HPLLYTSLLRLHLLLPSHPPPPPSPTPFPYTTLFRSARVPSDSKGSECQCGIHTAEAASALRSRKTQRAAKEVDANLTNFLSTEERNSTRTHCNDVSRLSAASSLPKKLTTQLQQKPPP